MKYLMLLIFAIFITQIGAAQSIQGIVFDKKTGEQLPFVNVILFEDSIQIAGVTTSIEGEYIFHIAPGIYDMEAVYVGYPNQQMTEVKVMEKSITKINIEMEEDKNGVDLSGIDVVRYPNIKLFRRDETLKGETLPRANQGAIKGKVFDEKTREGLPFANVILLQKGIQIDMVTTNLEGNYVFERIESGEYDVEAVYVGYPNARITGILVDENLIPLNISMTESGKIRWEDVIVRSVNIPIIRVDQTSTGAKWEAYEIKRFSGF